MRIWRLCRPRPGMMVGMGGGGAIPVTGHLPEAGGVLDQGNWLVEAFDVLDNAEAQRKRG